MRRTAITVLALATLGGCGGSPATSGGGGAGGDLGSSNPRRSRHVRSRRRRRRRRCAAGDLAMQPGGGGALTPAEKAVAEALTSIWENDTPILDYAYSENINDGRGYTSGRAGFCTGTGDAIQVIDCYDKLRTAANGNVMAKYMPALTTINDKYMQTGQDQGDTSLLDAVGNWINDWGASYNTRRRAPTSSRARIRSATSSITRRRCRRRRRWALQKALTRAALYDMWINQGDDTLVKQTNSALGVKATIGVGNTVTEDQWLQKFLELRRDLLAGDSTWASSVDRVAGYEKARRRGNWDLAAAPSTARSRRPSAGRAAAIRTAATPPTSSTPTARRPRRRPPPPASSAGEDHDQGSVPS